MSLDAKAVAAFLLSGLGTTAVYLGMFLNMAALGSTLGYIAMGPGLLLLAAATLPIRAAPKKSVRYVGVAALRYSSLPVFVLGAVMLALSLPSVLNAKGQVHGFGEAVALTVAGLAAVLWPEVLVICRRIRGGNT